jgi:response regulator of citrate/malate metabolism
MSGAEFIISCKEKWEGEIPPVMVCSSASEVPLVKKIASMGIAGYIVKPVDYRTLIDKLKKMFPEIRDFRAKK